MDVERVDLIGLPGGSGVADFAPVAYYDKHMDCIRVFTHDRSVTEVRINETFTLHRCNHMQTLDPEYVGFTLKGICHLFAELGIPVSGVLTLAEILDRLVKHRPVGSMTAIAYLLLKEHESIANGLNVTLDDSPESEAAA